MALVTFPERKVTRAVGRRGKRHGCRASRCPQGKYSSHPAKCWRTWLPSPASGRGDKPCDPPHRPDPGGCYHSPGFGVRGTRVFEILKAGGWGMVPILLCSAVALAIILERFWTLRRVAVLPPGLGEQVRGWARTRKLDPAHIDVLRQNSPLGRSEEHTSEL